MPCEFKKGQKVKAIGSGKIHIITGIRKDPPREILAGWGLTSIQDVFIQVDSQRDRHGQPLWNGWGNFKAI
ncbi:MAG: hypothetical protein WCV71_01280 [Patescibacteria group bacterium]